MLSWSFNEAQVKYPSRLHNDFCLIVLSEHIPASHHPNQAIWKQWDRLETSVEVELGFVGRVMWIGHTDELMSWITF
jgi:hypothetical protein